MRKVVMFILLLCYAKLGICASHVVRSQQDFSSISRLLKPGDTVKIANGTYSPWTTVINSVGTVNQPVVVQAETSGLVIFTGDVSRPIFRITGSHVVLRGIKFKECTVLKSDRYMGSLVELYNSKNCRLTDCVFEGNSASKQYMPIVIISGNNDKGRIDNCIFSGNLNNQDIQVRVNKSSLPISTIIENNLFKDKVRVKWIGSNGGECIQIGQDNVARGSVITKSIVRGNRFIRCSGDAEVISNKSSGNIYDKNYFEDCHGELVMRGGNDCIINNNTIKGGRSGIRVSGTGHQVTRNNISNVRVGIRLMYGMTMGRGTVGFYVTASDCTVANNHFENVDTGILVGDGKNIDWSGKLDLSRNSSRLRQDIKPSNNKLLNNTFTGAIKQVVNN